MKARANSRRWAAGWLRGIAQAVRANRLPPKALQSAVARAFRSGLTTREITEITGARRS
jgi:hypothetical protein